MSEHSIEELKRQMQMANDKLEDARRKASAAKDRYYAALLEATGFKNCIAEYTRRRGFGSRAKMEVIRFVATRVSPYRGDIEGPRIKANGDLSAFDGRCSVAEAKNLGPYKPEGDS